MKPARRSLSLWETIQFKCGRGNERSRFEMGLRLGLMRRQHAQFVSLLARGLARPLPAHGKEIEKERGGGGNRAGASESAPTEQARAAHHY